MYWYTTKLNRKVHQVKNGSARRRANTAYEVAEVRIKEQLTAANSADPYEILWVEDVSDLCETGEKHESLSKLRQLEQSVLHPKQKRMGMWVPSDNTASEWFFDPKQESVDNVVNIGKQLINECRHGVMALEDFPAFPYQQSIVDWADKQFKTKNDILVNAIMRAGKCFITYEIARKLKAKTVLIVTAKVGVNDSWSALLPNGEESHVNYADWHYHDYKKIKHLDLAKGQTNVVFVSLQYINKHFDNPPQLLKDIFDQQWDLVGFDEQHYATETDNTQRLWDTLDFSKKVELSGTPYKTVLSGRYDQSSIYNFDYVEEQLLRQQAQQNPTSAIAKAFNYRADINYAMVQVPNKVKEYLGEDGFTFPKLFATEQGQFVNTMAVNEFLTHVVKTYKTPPARFNQFADKLSRHAIWILPNAVSAINAFEQMLISHPFFGKRRIINASGSGVQDIQTVKDLIQRDTIEGGVGTITLTCGRFLEGTSVPEWWSVHQMNNDKSAADYFQGSFRCKTPWAKGDKTSVIVYDYAPERFVSVVYQHCEQISLIENCPVEPIISQWLAVSEVYDYDGNQWNVLTGNDISQRFLSDINNYMDRVGQAVNRSGINDGIVALLENLKKDSNQVSATSQLNGNDILEGTNKKRITSKSSSAEKEEDVVEETVQRIRYALRQIYELINIAWAEGWEINRIEDVVASKDPELVYDITGISPAEWKKILPAVNIVSMNRAIGQYNAL
jgi:Type III restriction enzyme, res subunit